MKRFRFSLRKHALVLKILAFVRTCNVKNVNGNIKENTTINITVCTIYSRMVSNAILSLDLFLFIINEIILLVENDVFLLSLFAG